MDATYKVNFFGYPLMVIGSVDANRKFHLIGTTLYVSETTTDYEFLFQCMCKVFFKTNFISNFIVIKKGVEFLTNVNFYNSYQERCFGSVRKTIQAEITNF